MGGLYMKWMISANGKMYDHAAAFEKFGCLDWRQHANYEVGDIVYIYCTKPYQRVKYKVEVLKTDMQFSECQDDKDFWFRMDEYENSKAGRYAKLKLIEQVDTVLLSLEYLKKHGLKAAPQGPLKVKEELSEYIDLYMNDIVSDGVFPDSDVSSIIKEGAVVSVKVNKYERSSIARQKCIEYHGTTCKICGFNFKEHYEDIGEDFIHVHHIIPVSEIGKEYVIDYKKDLIPVCPNCHAMLHRKDKEGKLLSVKQLIDLVK
ncbi:MAG: HNH endonuclease [Anaerovoracaceae bacterium]